jgi:hypothetical protein
MRLFFLAYMTHDTGSSAAMSERGSMDVSPFSHKIVRLFMDP